MAVSPHVNGPAQIFIGSSSLGYSIDGVAPEFEYGREEVYSDRRGPFVPIDVLDLGEKARISFELIEWDQSVFESALTAMGTEGSFTGAGTLLLASNKTVQLTIAGSPAPLIFYACYLLRHWELKLTKTGRLFCEFVAIPNNSGFLYTRGVVEEEG